MRSALVSGPPNRKKPYNKHLISLVFSVRTVNYGSSFFPSIYGPRALRLGHKSMEENLVRNLQYGPKTRPIRGIYLTKVARYLRGDGVSYIEGRRSATLKRVALTSL